MAALTLDNINKIYPVANKPPVHAVQDFSLEIADGEFLALLGPSGCGKSSTLRMVVGLEEITSGNLLFDGKRVNDLDPQKRNVAMGFENYALYPNLTVRRNLSFPLEIANVNQTEIDQRVNKITELLDIGSILDSKPPELSGGQQQRVSLGRALVRQPAAFILDEVMSHVDTQLKFKMLDELSQIHREIGRTTMYVTHDQLEALALADRVAVMHQAKLQQVGTRRDLFLQPANTFVAGFIGEPSMNILSCDYVDSKVVFGNGSMELGLSKKPNAKPADGLLFGCRPQHMQIDPDSSDLRAEVLVREYLGERIIYTLTYTDNNSSRKTTFKVVAKSDNLLKVGDTTGCKVVPEHCVFFDNGSGNLIN